MQAKIQKFHNTMQISQEAKEKKIERMKKEKEGRRNALN